jgi:hypothetical protein
LLSVLKNQNDIYIQDGVENVYIFLAICSKMIFLPIFLWFFYILDKNKTFMEILENSKWRNNLIRNVFFKQIQDFIIAQPLNEMFSFFDML